MHTALPSRDLTFILVRKFPIEYRQGYHNRFIGNNAKVDKSKTSKTVEENDIVEQQEISVLKYI